MKRFLEHITAFVMLVAIVSPAFAQDNTDAMKGFAPFIGEWFSKDGYSKQIISWGMGRKLVRARIYNKMDGSWRLVSEGTYFHNRLEHRVEGHFVSRDTGDIYAHAYITGRGRGIEFSTRTLKEGGRTEDTVDTWVIKADGNFHYTTVAQKGRSTSGYWIRAEFYQGNIK